MRMFGAGTLIGRSTAANSTPIQFGILQDVSLDFTFTLKELYGSKQFPADIGRGTAKITGKAKQGDIDADLYNQLFFNDPLVGAPLGAGQLLLALSEVGVIPTTPFTITVANAATFISDEGVKYSLTGQRLQRVASAPIAGEYSVNEATGVYTFAAADVALAVLINYLYTSTTGGKKFVITSNLLGDAPTFGVVFNGIRNTKQINITLVACVSTKLTLATKIEDFLIPEFDFQAMADASDTVGTISISN